MSSAKFFLTLLFFPFLSIFLISWAIYWKIWGKKQEKQDKKRKEWEKKLLAHIYNFSPARLKNRTWQRNIVKHNKKRKRIRQMKSKTKKIK